MLKRPAIKDHVHQSAQELVSHSPVLKHEVEEGKIKVIEAYYELDTGKVKVIEAYYELDTGKVIRLN